MSDNAYEQGCIDGSTKMHVATILHLMRMELRPGTANSDINVLPRHHVLNLLKAHADRLERELRELGAQP